MRLQEQWRSRVLRETTGVPIRTVAGVDVGVRDEVARAAIAVFTWPELEPLESASATQPVEFPYVPGLLGFREVPCIVAAYRQLAREPDLMIVDGQGLAHPRGFGVATHLGVELDRATIGCAKSLLVGEFAEPGPKRGASTRLRFRGDVIGRVVRTRAGVNPVFVSIGHRVDLDSAVRIVLRSCRGYRLPEPIRAAHRLAGGG